MNEKEKNKYGYRPKQHPKNKSGLRRMIEEFHRLKEEAET